MLTIIIVIVLGILIGAFGLWLDEGGADAFIAGGIGGAFCGALVAVICALVVGLFANNHTTWKTTSTPLVSLADGSDTHGSFFLGSGVVNSNPSFTWYEREGGNSYVRKDVEADLASIHYIAPGVTPYYTHSKKVRSGPTLNKWGFNTTDPYEESYDFYVPRGSIVQSYKLDNK